MLRPDPVRPARAAAFAAVVALMTPILVPIASGLPPMGDDLGRFHHPIRAFYAKCLADGDEPLWHPGLLCGVYVHGEGQAGMDHPLHRVLYAALPLDRAFAVEVAVGYPVAFLGMFLWMRRIGLRAEASALGGILLAFSAFFLFRYVHTNAVQVLAHLPWIALGVEAMADPRPGRSALLPACGVAAATTSQGLLGYPQYLAFSLAATGSLALLRLGRAPRKIGLFAAAVALGLAAAASQILPQLDALAASTRSRPDLAFLGKHSLHPMNLLQTVCPFAFRQGYYRVDGPAAWPRHESVAYVGAVVPALLAWLWVRRRRLGRATSLTVGASVLCAASLVLAVGRFSPLFPYYARLPGVGVFRGPARFFVLAQLGAAVLSAIAFSDLVGVARRGGLASPRSIRGLGAPIALSLAAAIGLCIVAKFPPAGLRREQIASVGDLARSVGWIAVPCVLVAMAARGRRLAPALLIGFAAIDATVFALNPIARHELANRPAAVPRSPGAGRAVVPWNETSGEGGKLASGYVALRPRRWLDPEDEAALTLSGVDRRLDDAGRWHVLGLAALPRARLVGRAKLSLDPRSDLRTIDLAHAALVDRPVAIDHGEEGSAVIVADRPGRIEVATEAPGRRLLVLSESHHPGWIAAIDGRPAEVVRVNGDYLGVVVGPGRMVVALRFAPRSAVVGRAVSLASALIIGLGAMLGWRKNVAEKSDPAP